MSLFFIFVYIFVILILIVFFRDLLGKFIKSIILDFFFKRDNYRKASTLFAKYNF